jgi:DNA-directed RNA polymerase subunit beta'
MNNRNNNKDKNPVKDSIKYRWTSFSWIYLERIKRWSFKARNDQLPYAQASVMVFSVKEFWTSKRFWMCLWKIQKNPLQRNHLWPLWCWSYWEKVRRDRVGHINLVVPIAHIWYFRSLPNKIGYILGLPSKKLDMITTEDT